MSKSPESIFLNQVPVSIAAREEENCQRSSKLLNGSSPTISGGLMLHASPPPQNPSLAKSRMIPSPALKQVCIQTNPHSCNQDQNIFFQLKFIFPLSVKGGRQAGEQGGAKRGEVFLVGPEFRLKHNSRLNDNSSLYGLKQNHSGSFLYFFFSFNLSSSGLKEIYSLSVIQTSILTIIIFRICGDGHQRWRT